MGSFLLFLFYDVRTASCNGDVLRWPDSCYCLKPTYEGLFYCAPTTGNTCIFS